MKRVRGLIYAAAFAVAATGCSHGPTTAVSGGESCAAALIYRGVMYLGGGPGVTVPEPGRQLGYGSVPTCDDGDGTPTPASRVRVLAIPGVRPAEAVLTRDGVWVARGAHLPHGVHGTR